MWEYTWRYMIEQQTEVPVGRQEKGRKLVGDCNTGIKDYGNQNGKVSKESQRQCICFCTRTTYSGRPAASF